MKVWTFLKDGCGRNTATHGGHEFHLGVWTECESDPSRFRATKAGIDDTWFFFGLRNTAQYRRGLQEVPEGVTPYDLKDFAIITDEDPHAPAVIKAEFIPTPVVEAKPLPKKKAKAKKKKG